MIREGPRSAEMVDFLDYTARLSVSSIDSFLVSRSSILRLPFPLCCAFVYSRYILGRDDANDVARLTPHTYREKKRQKRSRAREEISVL